MCFRAKSCCCGLASLESGAKFIALAGLVCTTLGFFYSYYCQGVLGRFPHEEALANFFPHGPKRGATGLALRIKGLFSDKEFGWVDVTEEDTFYYDFYEHYKYANDNYNIGHPKIGIAANIVVGALYVVLLYGIIQRDPLAFLPWLLAHLIIIISIASVIFIILVIIFDVIYSYIAGYLYWGMYSLEIQYLELLGLGVLVEAIFVKAFVVVCSYRKLVKETNRREQVQHVNNDLSPLPSHHNKAPLVKQKAMDDYEAEQC